MFMIRALELEEWIIPLPHQVIGVLETEPSKCLFVDFARFQRANAHGIPRMGVSLAFPGAAGLTGRLVLFRKCVRRRALGARCCDEARARRDRRSAPRTGFVPLTNHTLDVECPQARGE